MDRREFERKRRAMQQQAIKVETPAPQPAVKTYVLESPSPSPQPAYTPSPSPQLVTKSLALDMSPTPQLRKVVEKDKNQINFSDHKIFRDAVVKYVSDNTPKGLISDQNIGTLVDAALIGFTEVVPSQLDLLLIHVMTHVYKLPKRIISIKGSAKLLSINIVRGLIACSGRMTEVLEVYQTQMLPTSFDTHRKAVKDGKLNLQMVLYKREQERNRVESLAKKSSN